MSKFVRTNTVIVGAGPIGLEVATELKVADVDYLHVDRGTIGQTMTWFPNGMTFFSSNDRIAIAGVPIQNADQSKTGRDAYLAYLRSVAMTYELDVRTYHEVTRIERVDAGTNGEGFHVHVQHNMGEMVVRCENVVLATGDMHGPRLLGVPGEKLPHVKHYFDDPHLYFGQRVLIVGGKNSAVEAALRCYHAGARVAMSYRKPQFPDSVKYWLLPELLGRLKREEIGCHYSTVPTRITPTHVTLTSCDEQGNVCEGATVDIATDFVLMMTGYVADMSLFESLGVELSEDVQTPTFDATTMETNVPGLYVAGTATAGTQTSYRVFIENCHIHAKRIAAALVGEPPPNAPMPIDRPES